MHPEVVWPNGWEGGWVEGIEGVRHYWRRQWAALDPHVEPRAFTPGADGGPRYGGWQLVGRGTSGGMSGSTWTSPRRLLPTWYPLLCVGFDLVVAGFLLGPALARRSSRPEAA
jgi:hypothetical protein